MVLCGCSRGSRGVFLRRGRECWRSSVSRQRRQRRRRPATAVDRPTTESTTVTTRQHLSTQGQHQEQKGQVKSTLVVLCLRCLCPSCAPADKPSSFHSVMQHQFFVFHSTVLHTNKGQHGIRRQVFESQFLIFWGWHPWNPLWEVATLFCAPIPCTTFYCVCDSSTRDPIAGTQTILEDMVPHLCPLRTNSWCHGWSNVRFFLFQSIQCISIVLFRFNSFLLHESCVFVDWLRD